MSDSVNHPAHYQGFSNGAEVIDITENLNFNLGNVVKYVARAGRKTDDPTEDLLKAQFYLEREIGRLLGEHPDDSMEFRLQDLPDLPEGLEYDESKFWRDNDEYLWRWSDGIWRYFDVEDDSWYEVTGPPSTIYAPFREVNLWLSG